ncbi:BTB and MATH domain-containing protein 38-like [Ruditapes philippinarum]|uniref:BTB and MATH domain-containing protein 38-like n=1 Tax=Ruditapes philippinarum TaxID=129788 RepID=UPI00295ADC39|nr:BTB and MATH domain-containing protein 38-like [Ruditapes philippinarum]XP_060563816.1 BTB and MATH domain-containing protein 38-like [Ruditapes philippinarum]
MSQEKKISCSSSEKEELQDKQILVNNEFCEENGIGDLTFIVENHKIPVSKTVLCIASPVFRTMLKGHFREKTETEIPLPGKSYESFVEFLRCIYPDKTKKVKEKNVYMLLPLAHEYNVEKMMKRCQKVIMQIIKNRHTRNVEELYRHIRLAELYSIEEMKERCIYLASENTLKQFKAARTMYQISDANYLTIIELALRRKELDKDDEKGLSLIKKESNDFFIDQVTFTLKGKIDMREKASTRCLKSLRLAERFNIQFDKSKLLDTLRHSYNKIKDNEEFDLLPDTIKSALKN